MEFQDKVVLITGAGRGAGRQLAEAFAVQGARLALNDISPQNVENLLADLRQRGDVRLGHWFEADVVACEDDGGEIQDGSLRYELRSYIVM